MCFKVYSICLFNILRGLTYLQRYLSSTLMLEKLSNPQNLWPMVRDLCNQTNSFIAAKSGRDLELITRCEQTKDFVMSNSGSIAIAVLLAFVILGCIWALKKLNSRIRVFDATLINIKEITHDTKIFTFDLPNGWNQIGLNIGQHLTLSAKIDGKVEQRKYTPISRSDVKRNSFDLLIKIYEKGKMSSYVNRMKKGEKIKVSLPYGRFNYIGNSFVRIKNPNNTALVGEFDHFYLIGGGTGITPLYQIIQFISDVEVPLGKGPKITLLFANKTESDILLKGELENYELSNPNFKCFFSVDKAEKDNWTGLTGFVDEQKIRQTLPEDTSRTLFAACGPPPMVNMVEKLITKNFNIKPERFFRF